MYLRPFTTEEGRTALISHLQSVDQGVNGMESLSAIQVPVALIWGDHDPYLRAAIRAQLGRRASPSVQVNPIKGARHFTPEEVPRAIATAIADLLELNP
jgi:pimeloyl-ACP methyl ester carboxylesterase